MKIKQRLVLWIFQFLRWYFSGRTVTRVTFFDGHGFAEAGKVSGGVIRRGPSGFPVDLEMYMTQPGQSPSDSKRFSALSLRHEKGIGWVFYD